jgi:hypothetical protein
MVEYLVTSFLYSEEVIVNLNSLFNYPAVISEMTRFDALEDNQ